MKKVKKQKVLVDTDIHKELERVFDCSRTMVNLSLNGHKDTDLARRIRKRAIDLGGSLKGSETIKRI